MLAYDQGQISKYNAILSMIDLPFYCKKEEKNKKEALHKKMNFQHTETQSKKWLTFISCKGESEKKDKNVLINMNIL